MKKLAFLLVLAVAAWAQGGHEAPPAHGAPAVEHGAPAEQGASGGGHHEAPMTAKWVNFAILAGALGFVAIKIGGPALKGQQQEILDSLGAAAKRAEEIAAEVRAIEAKIAGLGGEVAELREKAGKELAIEEARFRQETNLALEKLEVAAEQEIASAAKFARAELKAEAAKLALELAEQKLKARMSGEAQGALVDRFVKTLGAQGEARS